MDQLVPYDDWEVPYRIRLPVERRIRRGTDAAKGRGRDGSGPFGPVGELLRKLSG